MSSQNIFWFHCGRCGALFQSFPGEVDERRCAKCGMDPSLGLAEPALPQAARPENSGAGEKTAGSEPSDRRAVRKRRNSHLMLKLVCAWLLVLALIVLLARHYYPDQKKAEQVADPKNLERRSNEEEVVYNEAWRQSSTALSNFLAAGTPEARNQFVFQPVRTASRMARFYSLNPIASVDPSSLDFSEHAVLDIPGGKQLESFWTATDGRKIDAVFRQENGEWKLDWDHFVRYSDYPWALFLAGTGSEEGEFRLLARERLAEDRKNAESISIVLYAPRFGNPRDAGFQSPEFLVSRQTRDGQLLDAAFKLTRQKKKVFGSTTSNIDPEGMIRVRAKVTRREENNERKFEISRIIACHWYSVDDPGVEPQAGK